MNRRHRKKALDKLFDTKCRFGKMTPRERRYVVRFFRYDFYEALRRTTNCLTYQALPTGCVVYPPEGPYGT